MKIYIYILTVFIIFSCGAKNESWIKTDVSYNDFLNRSERSLNFENYDKVIVIPDVGCNECIDDAFAYFNENSNNERILFIFTEILDPKIFSKKVNVNIQVQKNVFIDEENLFRKLDISILLPYEIKLKNNLIYLKVFTNR